MFDDVRRSFNPQKAMIWQGKLGPDGTAPFTLKPEINTASPGALKALFILRVFEPSGQFSTQYKEAVFHPYDRYAGLSLPAEFKDAPLSDNATMAVNTVLVDQQGKRLAQQQLRVQVFKLRWSWWWDGEDNQYSYASDADNKEVTNLLLTTDASGMAGLNIKAADYEQGRYRLVVCDESGADAHCASQIFYNGWAGVNNKAATAPPALASRPTKNNIRSAKRPGSICRPAPNVRCC